MGFHTHSLAPLTSPCIRGKSNPGASRGPTVEVISPQRGSDNPHSGPELETHLSPGAAAMSGLPLPTPPSPPAPLTLSTSSFQSCGDHTGPVSGGRRGHRSAGDRRWGRPAEPPSLCPAPAPQTPSSSPHTLPHSLPQPQQKLRLGRGLVWGALTSQSSPTCHMQGGGQPAGKSCLGFSCSVNPQALRGVSRERSVPHPTLTLS